MRTITHIIIHCSATKAGQRYTFEQCRRDHMARGWKDIGYHYYITRDGVIHEGRKLYQVGAHCKGYNQASIGICYEGGLDDRGQAADTRTQSQRKALRTLLKSLHHRFPEALIAGHRDLSPDLDGNGCVDPTEWVKQCPSFNAMMTYWDLQPAGIFD